MVRLVTLMLTALSAALVYGLTGGLAPGPLMTLVLTQTIRHGAREGMKTALAPLITDGPIMLVLLLFLDEIAAIRPLVGAIGIAGTLYLLYLAWESWTSKPPSPGDAVAAPQSLLRGALVNFLNPHPYLFWLTAGTPMLAKAWRHSGAAAIAFVALFFVCLVGSKILLALAIARSRERIVGRWYRPAMRVLAVLIVVFAGIVGRDAMMLLW
ncbi:MAG TPA: LysE family translocator [Thermoanaerobaculia bacterium]|nr:LysE family translocator [Thermoanaerobaculia bacterium]